jgi:NAD(P)-dependent dehydrogenase (short-subunit alcohol dehydrogenase family)
MKVLVLGGTGLIGSAITARLVSRGDDVVVASRHPQKGPLRHVAVDLARAGDAFWRPHRTQPNGAAVDRPSQAQSTSFGCRSPAPWRPRRWTWVISLWSLSSLVCAHGASFVCCSFADITNFLSDAKRAMAVPPKNREAALQQKRWRAGLLEKDGRNCAPAKDVPTV